MAPEFLAELEVVLVEASPALQEIAGRKTARTSGARYLAGQAHFDDSLADRPLFLLANEFFDALPIRQYVKTERGWCERMVVATNGELDFALAPVPAPSAAIPADRAGAPDGGVYEVSPAATALAEDIARIIAAQRRRGADPGLWLWRGGRLLAKPCRRWAATISPTRWPSRAKMIFPPMWISPRLAEAARRGGAAVFGPRDRKAMFLADLGITARAEQLMKANPGDGAEAACGASSG